MLRAVLMTMWRWTRWVVIVFAVAAFAIPVLTAANLGGLRMADLPVNDVLSAFSVAGLIYIPMSALLGLLVAAGAWGADIQLGFVYVLVHPVPRWYFVLLRFASGAIILGIPVLGVLLGCLVVTLAGSVPEFVHAYPVSLTVRFAAALFFTYAVCFGAVGAGRGRVADSSTDVSRVLIGLGVFLAGVVALTTLDRLVLQSAIADFLLRWMDSQWSPIGLYVGRWGLFDV